MALSRGTNPLMDNTGMEGIPLRTSPWNPAGGGGGNFAGALSAMEQFGQKAYQASMPDFGTPAAPRPVKAFSPSSGKLFVNGFTFDVDDAQRALESEQYLGAAPQALPAGDWIPLDDASYSAYLEGIRNPTMGRLAAKNFGRGVDISQLLAGRALQFAGAEDLGGRVAEAQMEDLRKTSPYERMFTDIGSQPNRGVLDWFVANLAQQGPNLVESAVTALVGAGVGAAAGGGPNPFSAAGGALAALSGRQAVKQSVLAAAKKYSRGEALDAAETKLLHEQAGILAAAKIKEGTLYAGPQGLMTAGQFTQYLTPQSLKAGATSAGRAGLQQSMVGGAAIASGLQNYATGVADIYGEGIEGGNPDRMYAAMAGIPYAAFETLPEFLLAGKIFGNVGGAKPRIRDIPGLGAKAATVGRRAGAGFVQGGLIEGATEASQEGLLFGANEDVDWNSPEGISRLINSFAAGFGVGGPIGAGANIAGKLEQNKPANLLDPAATTEPPAAETVIKPPAPEPTPPTAELMPRVAGLLGGPGMQAPQGFPALMVPPVEPTAAAEPVAPPVGPPTGPGTVIPMPYAGAQTDNLLAPGQQGVLDIFGPMTEAELAQRAQPMQYGTEEVPAEGTQTSTGQGALQFAPTGQAVLQFAPPAPGGMRFTNESPPPTGAIGQQLSALQQQQQLQQEFEAAQRQRQAELDAQREADFNRMEAQRQQRLGRTTTLDTFGMDNPPSVDMEAPATNKYSIRFLSEEGNVYAVQAVDEQDRVIGEMMTETGASVGNMFVSEANRRTGVNLVLFDALRTVYPTMGFATSTLTADGKKFAKAVAKIRENVALPSDIDYKGQRLRRGKGKGKPPAPKGARLTVGKGGQMEAFGKQKLVPVAPEPKAPAAAAGPAPKQLQLFTRTGKPTKEAVKGNKLKKGRKNVQERVAEAVPAAQPAGTGQAVGGTNAGAGATTRKALPLRKGKTRPKKFAVQEKQTVPVDPYDQAESDLYDLDLEVPTKGEVKKFAQRLVKQGLLTEEDISFISSMMKDKDMSGEDIVSELRSAIRIAKDRVAKTEAELKRPKDEAAAEAAESPVAIDLTFADGTRVKSKDGQKLLTKLENDIDRFEQLLKCIRG